MDGETRVLRKQKLSKKEKRREKKRIKKERRRARPLILRILGGFFRYLRWTMLLGIFAIGIVLASFWTKYGQTVSEYITEGYEIASTIDKKHFSSVEPSVLIDGNGNKIRDFKERNYTYLSLAEDDDLYQKVSDVVVSIEDERFYLHKGFDYYGVGAAVINYLRGHDLRGASTITQQLVKNTYLTQDQTMGRKITEAVIAQEMEKVLTKREILEYYVNDNYYSQGQYGLETASEYYFSKPVSELSIGQLSVLVGIPNNPSIYDPIENPENAVEKRDIILGKMFELGKITEEVYKTEIATPLELAVTDNSVNNTVSDYAETYAIHKAVEKIMETNGFSLKFWFETEDEMQDYIKEYNELYYQTHQDVMRGGYVIETSIDPEKQEALQEVMDQSFDGYWETDEETGLYAKQGAATIIDNRTNEVVAIVGGRTQEGNTYNRAFQSARQPGSTIKPFVSYTPAFEQGYSLLTEVDDKPIENGPQNWYLSYWGKITMRYALEQSVNTVPYRLMNEVGIDFALNKLEKMQFNNLHPSDYNPIIAVGGFTLGTNTTEMAGATSTLVNDGLYHEATNVRKVTDIRTNQVIFDKEMEEPIRVYKSGASYLTLMGMQDVVDKTASNRDWGYEYLAGKTGTTDNEKELWFIGATPYYSAAVYVGYDTPTAQDNVATSNIIAQLFREGMKSVHVGLPVIDFERPKTVSIDSKSKDMWINETSENEVQKERLYDESNRQDLVRERQSNRLAELDYRLVHGLSKEEEESRERVAEAKITLLENFEVTLTQEQMMDDYFEEATKAIERVKRSSVAWELTERLSLAYELKMNDLSAIKAQIQWEKEQERIRIQEEKDRAERERLAIEEEKRRELEEKLKKQTEEEEEKLNKQFEEESLKKEEEKEKEEKEEKEEEKDSFAEESIESIEEKETEE